MCIENGFLMDDGVVARLAEDTWLCHTTTGGADRIHAHMEDWLQSEWWDWKVYDRQPDRAVRPGRRGRPERAQAAGKARRHGRVEGGAALHALGRRHAWRLSRPGSSASRFSGELSLRDRGARVRRARAFWDALLAAGAEFGITPYGTEALHVMRAEKGFIMIGDETDGTVIPQDLGLDWAISKKKDDYPRQARAGAVAHGRSDRWKLVGLETLDGSVLPDGAYAVAPGGTPTASATRKGA